VISVYFPSSYPVSASSLRFQVTDCGPSLIVCVSQYSFFFLERVLSAVLVLFPDTFIAVVTIPIAAVNTGISYFPHWLSFYTQIFIFEIFSLFCIILYADCY
jgi:hypothetical protein